MSERETEAQNEKVATKKPERNGWATASFVFCVLGYVVFLGIGALIPLPSGAAGDVGCSAFVCWLFSFVFGIIALVEIRMRRPAFKGTLEAMFGVCLSVIPFVWSVWVALPLWRSFFGEPLDESDPVSVVATIENDCYFEFPERMESLKAADGLTGGPDSRHVFVVSFMTDQSGFAQLHDSLSLLGNCKEITNELSRKDYDTDDYDPRDWAYFEYAPQWYKVKIAKGRTYEGHLECKRMCLSTFCVELAEPNKVAVYMEGFGDYSLKKDKGLSMKNK